MNYTKWFYSLCYGFIDEVNSCPYNWFLSGVYWPMAMLQQENLTIARTCPAFVKIDQKYVNSF